MICGHLLVMYCHVDTQHSSMSGRSIAAFEEHLWSRHTPLQEVLILCLMFEIALELAERF